jgi:TolB-like protein/Tfp pilus assembly protein PilF
MIGETSAAQSASSMSTPSKAVFVSYASEDAPAAQRIAEALRAAGIEVWFDREELRGGDAWDRRIREQIHECRLFVPVISAQTEAREEGYFRREWKLAVDRTHDMAEKRAFLVPVVVDGTSERGASVPEKFRELQWSRLPGGEASPAFVERVQRLLSPAPATSRPLTGVGSGVARAIKVPVRASRSRATRLVIVAVIVAASLGYWALDRFWISKPVASPSVASASPTTTTTPTTAAAFAPPPHSIAVLPFVNMSGDANQEYFSDGISEELLDALSRLNDLQVAARTSSFSFKGKDVDISTIAHKLNVGAVLEGSVRRSGSTIRITVQLIDAVTGFHIWSQSYDRNFTDILKLQTEVATSVAQQLKVKLVGDEGTKIELGGTKIAAAYDAYLRGLQRYEEAHATERDYRDALAAFDGAISLDPNYAMAYARRAAALDYIYRFPDDPNVRPAVLAQAREAAERALALAPQLGEAHLVLAYTYCRGLPDLAAAAREYERAVALAPGSAWVQRGFGFFAAKLGHFELALAAARRAVSLDPRKALTRQVLAEVLIDARRYGEALRVLEDAMVLSPGSHVLESLMQDAVVASGQIDKALVTCESPSTPLDDDDRHSCLALVYHKLGRQADAVREMEKFKAVVGDDGAYGIAGVYAQWGDKPAALQWLIQAEHLHNFDLLSMKVEWMFDPIRNEPQFEAIEARLHFPP